MERLQTWIESWLPRADVALPGNSAAAWLTALLAAGAPWIAVRLINAVVLARLRMVAERTETPWDDVVIVVVAAAAAGGAAIQEALTGPGADS